MSADTPCSQRATRAGGQASSGEWREEIDTQATAETGGASGASGGDKGGEGGDYEVGEDG